jgi:hypothetical protein
VVSSTDGSARTASSAASLPVDPQLLGPGGRRSPEMSSRFRVIGGGHVGRWAGGGTRGTYALELRGRHVVVLRAQFTRELACVMEVVFQKERYMAARNDAKAGLPAVGGSLSAAELKAALSANAPFARTKVRGWVKDSTAKGCIAFAPLRRCGAWVDIPMAAIASVEVLGSASCDDHSHGDVVLQLSLAPEYVTIGQLITQLQALDGQVSGRRARALGRNSAAAPGGCFGHWNEEGEWVCDEDEEGGGNPGSSWWAWQLLDENSGKFWPVVRQALR